MGLFIILIICGPPVLKKRQTAGTEAHKFGGIAVYLASDTSKYHTADTFVIDGGYLVF